MHIVSLHNVLRLDRNVVKSTSFRNLNRNYSLLMNDRYCFCGLTRIWNRSFCLLPFSLFWNFWHFSELSKYWIYIWYTFDMFIGINNDSCVKIWTHCRSIKYISYFQTHFSRFFAEISTCLSFKSKVDKDLVLGDL